MAITKAQARKVRQPSLIGDIAMTAVLDVTTTSEIVEFSCVAEKVSFQADGDLAGNVEFSIDGVNYKHTTAIGATNVIVTFNTHMCKSIKVTRTGGTGRLHILAR